MDSTHHRHNNRLRAGWMSGLIVALLSVASAQAAPPIGSTCTSSGDKQICKYPNGTTWVCDSQLNSCTRIGRKAPTGTMTPGGATMKPMNKGEMKPAMPSAPTK